VVRGAGLDWACRLRVADGGPRDGWALITAATVEVIQAADRERGIASLTLAFANDPVMRWVWPEAYRYAAHWPRFAEAFGGAAFDHGTAYGLEDLLAVALWMRPGVGPDEKTVMGVMRESVNDAMLEDLSGLFERMDELHPTADVWYLPLIGVDPVAQGGGLGSALLRHALARCDSEGLPAYLEATNPRNRDLYSRHGFNVLDVIQAGSSPPIWAMLREPVS
jgi:GNAT superfamily N-acetyltransferase